VVDIFFLFHFFFLTCVEFGVLIGVTSHKVQSISKIEGSCDLVHVEVFRVTEGVGPLPLLTANLGTELWFHVFNVLILASFMGNIKYQQNMCRCARQQTNLQQCMCFLDIT